MELFYHSYCPLFCLFSKQKLSKASLKGFKRKEVEWFLFFIWIRNLIFQLIFQLYKMLRLHNHALNKSCTVGTLPPKNNKSLSLRIFKAFYLHSNLTIFGKKLRKPCSSLLHASFETFWVQIDRLRHDHWSFKRSMKS